MGPGGVVGLVDLEDQLVEGSRCRSVAGHLSARVHEQDALDALDAHRVGARERGGVVDPRERRMGSAERFDALACSRSALGHAARRIGEDPIDVVAQGAQRILRRLR
jgi:hypothetical protein